MNVHSLGRMIMDKKEKIFLVAEKLLAEHGVYGLSMKLLADTAGIAAGTIYRYFENKEALLHELHQHICKQSSLIIFKGWSDVQEPKLKYDRLWSNAFHAVLNNPKRVAVIEMLNFVVPPCQAESAAIEENTFFPLIDFYQQGINEGRFHDWHICALITLSFDTSINLAKKISRRHIEIDEMLLNQVRDASWLSIQKVNSAN